MFGPPTCPQERGFTRAGVGDPSEGEGGEHRPRIKVQSGNKLENSFPKCRGEIFLHGKEKGGLLVPTRRLD